MSAASSQGGLDGLTTGSRASHLVPVDWPFAVRTGTESVLLGWLLVIVPTLAVFVSTSSMDAAAALSLGTALRTGTGLWSLGLGGSYGSPSSADGVISLPLLGLSLVQVLLTRSSVRRARLTSPASGAWVVLSSVLTAMVLVLLTAPGGSRTWTAVLGAGVLTALVTAWTLQVSGRGSQALALWWSRRPTWVSVAQELVRTSAVLIGVLVALGALLAVVSGAARFGRLQGAVSGGGVLSGLGLLLLQLGWVPTTLVWVLSWLVGPGFVVGTGTVFTPDRVVAGSVPSLPLLGFLPTNALTSLGLFVPLPLTLVGLVAAWRCRRHLAALRLGHSVAAALAATLALCLATLVLCLVASGSVGPGRMTDVGPRCLLTTGLLLLELGAGLAAGSALVHPLTRRATERGVEVTTSAAGAAAHGTRERVEAGVGAARDRHAEGRRERAERRQDKERDQAPEPQTDAEAPSTRRDTRGSRGGDQEPVTEPLLVVVPDPDDAPEVARFTGWRARLAQRLDDETDRGRPRPSENDGSEDPQG